MKRPRLPRVLVVAGDNPGALTLLILVCLAMILVSVGNLYERHHAQHFQAELNHVAAQRRADGDQLRINDRTISGLQARITQLEDCIRDPNCDTVPPPPTTTTTTPRPHRTTSTTTRKPTTTRPPRTTTTTLACPTPTIPVNGMCVMPSPPSVP